MRHRICRLHRFVGEHKYKVFAPLKIFFTSIHTRLAKMHLFNLALAICAAQVVSGQATGKLGDAAAITNNPEDASYVAAFPNHSNQSIHGVVFAKSGAEGKGVVFDLVVRGLPRTGGPFSTPLTKSSHAFAQLANLLSFRLPYSRPTGSCEWKLFWNIGTSGSLSTRANTCLRLVQARDL